VTFELFLQRDPKQIGQIDQAQYSKLTVKNTFIFCFGIKTLFITGGLTLI